MKKKIKLQIPIIIPNQQFYNKTWRWNHLEQVEMEKQWDNQKKLSLKSKRK